MKKDIADPVHLGVLLLDIYHSDMCQFTWGMLETGFFLGPVPIFFLYIAGIKFRMCM